LERLAAKSLFLVEDQSLNFIRSLAGKIDWKDRLIGILGARGTGKTTLLLQRIKQQNARGVAGVYLSLDDIYFTANRLSDTVEELLQRGITTFYLDEVHRYPDWAREIKNLYDYHKEVKIIFTGSCITDILRQNTDLSRRAIQYELPGLSYREYLQFTGVFDTPMIKWEDILSNHAEIATHLRSHFKPLQHFREYLQTGYYPFFAENLHTYSIRLQQVVQLTIESDLQFMEGFDSHHTRKIYQLFYILATNVPFKPNITKLAEKTDIHRNTLVRYLHYLEKARLINSLSATGKSISILQKPDKIFLENTNLHFALSTEKADKGSLRESFFLNQLRHAGHTVSLPPQGDFLVDGKDTVEVGGRDKSASQLHNVPHAWIAADDIEAGSFQKIPLWLFGMLY
jgi:uncharacterized protein